MDGSGALTSFDISTQQLIGSDICRGNKTDLDFCLAVLSTYMQEVMEDRLVVAYLIEMYISSIVPFKTYVLKQNTLVKTYLFHI